MTGCGTDQPFVTEATTPPCRSKRMAAASTMERPKMSEAKTTNPSRNLPRSSEADKAKAKKARIKLASRKDGKGWRVSKSAIRPRRISKIAYRNFSERLRLMSGPAPCLFAFMGKEQIRCFADLCPARVKAGQVASCSSVFVIAYAAAVAAPTSLRASIALIGWPKA